MLLGSRRAARTPPQQLQETACCPQLDQASLTSPASRGTSRETRRRLVATACEWLQTRVGFQRDSVRNQIEHVEALWGSFITRYPDDPEAALLDLRRQLLLTQRRWRAQVWQPLMNDVDEEEDDDPLLEVCLYWLIWGELGNLRFCPELACFLCAAARAHCRSADPADAAAPAGHFLHAIVKPIYAVVVAETFDTAAGGAPKPKYGRAPAPSTAANYDDWNELFWDPWRLQSALRMKSAPSKSSGLVLKDADPATLWSRLPDVDWAASLAGRKSHLEFHSLLPLLVSCYRIFLVQSVAFAIMVLYAVTTEAEHNSRLGLAAVGLIAPAWMVLYEIGHQVLTPSLAWRSRIMGIFKLVSFYLLPVVSFLGVIVVELKGDLRTRVVSAFNFRITVTSQAWALGVHLGLSAVVLLMALTPQRQNLYRWRFYPSLLQSRTPLATAFWFAAVGMTFGMSFLVLQLCGESFHGIWLLHGGSVAMPWADWAQMTVQLTLLLLPTWLCFCASLPFFTSIVTATVGAVIGIHRLGGLKLIWYRRGVGLTRLPRNLCSRVLQLPHVRPADFNVLKAFKWWSSMSDRELESFVEVWNAMIEELRGRDLLSDRERLDLHVKSVAAVRQGDVPRLLDPLDVFRLRNSLPANREARRRIVALARSSQMQPLPTGKVEDMPMLSVLVPHYSETILFNQKDLFADGRNTPLLHYLVKYYRGEFANFAERVCGAGAVRSLPDDVEAGSAAEALRGAELEEALGRWTSVRMQTLWRTVEGVCSAYTRALSTVAKQQAPESTQSEREQLVKGKLQVVLAVQQYAKFADPSHPNFDIRQLAAVEALLSAFGDWLSLAIIEEEAGPHGRRYFSSMVDASCPVDPTRRVGSSQLGMRVPKFRVELPGFPILGHGKSDNQNCAIIYTRGEVLQMIDANQDAYFESALFLPLALQEMVGLNVPEQNGRRPGILGSREHIFSDVGLLGRLAADSEFTFGTIVQRTMDWPLQSRLHYGHPDVMDKLQMVQQGGVSKGTRGLNLSEDVFAGLDLVLRGGWTKYQEYFHVGKGRDMGFMSALSFYAKISMGNGEQAITRQWTRMGIELPVQRLFGVFYTHVGYYLTQALMSKALQVFGFMAAFFAVSGHADAAVGISTSYFGFLYLLFVLASMLPLLFELCIEEGLRAALRSVANSLLSLSPVFSAFQSKLMGYYFETTVHYGGAQYIPTGRGLATAREPFQKLFQTFACTHMQDGFELAALLCMSSRVGYGWAFYLCMVFSIMSWTFAPFLFNPKQFDDPMLALRDMRQWAAWLWEAKGSETQSWRTWATSQQDLRSHSSLAWIFLPSPRLLAAVFTSVLIYGIAPPIPYEPSLAWCQSLLPWMPPVLHIVACALVAPVSLCMDGQLGPLPAHVILAAVGVSLTCLELSAVDWYEPSALAVALHKYVLLRFLLEAADGVAAHRLGGCCCAVVHEACRLWAHSWRLARDVVLGVLLSSLCLAVSCLPFIARLHSVFLFQTRPQKDTAPKIPSVTPPSPDREEEQVIRALFETFAPQAVGQAAAR